MGLRASLTLITGDQFSTLLDDPNADVTIEPRIRFDLDKAWMLFEEVLSGMGEPLSLAVRGDYPQGGTMEESEDGTYFALISPDLVYRVTEALNKVDPEDILARAPKNWRLSSEDIAYYRDFYFELKIGYRVADRIQAGFMVNIS